MSHHAVLPFAQHCLREVPSIGVADAREQGGLSAVNSVWVLRVVVASDRHLVYNQRLVAEYPPDALYQSPCLSTNRDSTAQTFLPWYGSTLALSLCIPAWPDQGDLRCIFSGTGAVPTVNVTLLSTKES